MIIKGVIKMMCQKCNDNEATVHLTKIINGEKNEIYLCEDCAKETGQIPFAANNPFAFQNLLKGILNTGVSSYEQVQESEKCDKCGISYHHFSSNGLFGCSHCYQAFTEKLDSIFKRVHGSTRHNGKVPKRRGGDLRLKKEIKELREEMQEAVQEEQFEKAAEIRDTIKEIKEQIGGE